MESWAIIERLVRGVLRRRKRLVAITGLVSLVMLLPPAYYLSKEPTRYQSTAVLHLQVRPDRVPVFQELSTTRPFPVQLAILHSRSLSEAVVASLPQASLQELIDSSSRLGFRESLKNLYLRWRGVEPTTMPHPNHRALAELQRSRVTFTASPERESGLVSISAEAFQPQVAVDIVNGYIEALMGRTQTFNADDARVTREYLERQFADVKRTLQASEHALQSFVASRGGVRLPDQSRVSAERLATTEAGLAEAESNRKMLQARLEALREKVEGQKRSGDTRAGLSAPRMSSPEVERLRTQLAQLETSLLDLRAKYTEQHPRIVVTKERIAELMQSLRGRLKDTVVTTPSPAAVPPEERVNFAEQLIAVETAYHAVVAQEEALRKQADMYRHSLKGLSGGEVEYTRLSSDAESQRRLHALLADKLMAARIREQGEMKIVKVIDPPSQPVPVANRLRLLVLAVAGGLALCLGTAVPAGVEWLHRKIENEDDAQLATGLPVLALVPRTRGARPIFAGGIADKGRGLSDSLMFTEAFRALRVGIELSTGGEPLRSLLVTSAFADEGKSTVVVNLGFALNESGRRVVLADTDFLRPTLHRTVKVRSTTGLVETLQSGQPLEQALAPVSEGLWLAQRGESFEPKSRGMLAGSRLRELVGELTSKADFVICDSSPVLLIPDNLLLASAVDGVLLVAKAGSTPFRDLARTKALLEGAGARLLGVVLNHVPPTPLKKHYRPYYESYVKTERK
jgi:succinoglycan biosynthesis transport protein ExoP